MEKCRYCDKEVYGDGNYNRRGQTGTAYCDTKCKDAYYTIKRWVGNPNTQRKLDEAVRLDLLVGLSSGDIYTNL